MKNSKLPLDLQYLFQNEYLDSIKILIILYQYKKRKKGVTLDEFNYYYTMTDLLEINQMQKYEVNREYFQDNYLANENKLRNYSISLKNQGLLDVKVEMTSKKSILYFIITDVGIKLVDGLENIYFSKIVEQFNFVHNTMKYSIMNQRKVLSRDEE